MDARDQRSFWDQHIEGWSASAYNKKAKTIPFVERIAQPFRKHLPLRQHLAAEIVAKSGAVSVLELGCGTGDFATELIQTSPTLKNYLGMDIAEHAVNEARQQVLAAAGSRVKVELRVSAVEDLDPAALESFDFVVALGLLPYLTDDGIRRLSAICKGKRYVMDYHPREATLFNAIHVVYRAAKGYPFYRMYSDSETKDLMARFGFAPFKLDHRGPLRMIESV
jgi:2-polyprenyl-3-methyl-5-hydroxy-6-metoxy-1,4-benzoquinol methylase